MKKIDKQIEEYLNYCENIRRLSKQTLRNKRWAFKWLLDSAKINDISQLSNNDLSKWIMEQTARGCSGRTINVRISNILTAVSYFKDTGVTIYQLEYDIGLKSQGNASKTLLLYQRPNQARFIVCRPYRVVAY